MMKIVGNPDGCCREDFKGKMTARDCEACYYSQVKEGRWCGSERCFNAQCLVAKCEK